MSNKEQELAALLQRLRERVSNVGEKIEESQKFRENLLKLRKEMKRSKKLTVRVEESFTEKQDVEGLWDTGALCCLKCERTCREAVTWPWDPSDAKVNHHGRCSSCPGKCPAEEHVRATWRYVMKTRAASRGIGQTKQTYRQNKKEITALTEQIKRRLEKLQLTKKAL